METVSDCFVWVVSEVTDMVEIKKGVVVGVFNSPEQASAYAKKRTDEREVITSVVRWGINESCPMYMGGMI